jgi:hypothetical protein
MYQRVKAYMTSGLGTYFSCADFGVERRAVMLGAAGMSGSIRRWKLIERVRVRYTMERRKGEPDNGRAT